MIDKIKNKLNDLIANFIIFFCGFIFLAFFIICLVIIYKILSFIPISDSNLTDILINTLGKISKSILNSLTEGSGAVGLLGLIALFSIFAYFFHKWVNKKFLELWVLKLIYKILKSLNLDLSRIKDTEWVKSVFDYGEPKYKNYLKEKEEDRRKDN